MKSFNQLVSNPYSAECEVSVAAAAAVVFV